MPVEGPSILVNPERCLGCHNCELACATAHTQAGSVLGAVLLGERLQPRNHVVQVDDRGNRRLLRTWNTEVELQACPECGAFFAPKPMAFLEELIPDVAGFWTLCPACRRQRTSRQYLQVLGDQASAKGGPSPQSTRP